MKNTMTTTKLSGFRVDDITYHGARRQSEIEHEIEHEEVVEEEVKAPVSLTPEQIKEFYKKKILVSRDSNEKRVYSQTISWIDELLDSKKQLIKLQEELNSKKEVEEVDNGIEEE